MQGAYLIDFYHVCEYLSEAAKAMTPDLAAQEAWMDAQEDALKTGRLENVLQRLANRPRWTTIGLRSGDAIAI